MKTRAEPRPAPARIPAAPPDCADEATKRAIAHALWTEIHWLMPRGRTVVVTVEGDAIAVELGPADSPAPLSP